MKIVCYLSCMNVLGGMASDSWTEDDLCTRSMSSAPMKKDVSLELLPSEDAHSGVDGYIPFPLSPVQISPLSDVNFCGNTRDISNRDVHDSNMMTETPQEVDVVQRAYDNQAQIDAFQLDCLEKLDGRFLSLGYQNNSSFNIQSDACGRKVNNMTESAFFSHGQLANHSLNNLGGTLPGFEKNVGGLFTREYSGNLTVSHNNQHDWQSATSGFDRRIIPVLPEGDINLHHFIPTPSSKTSGPSNEMDSGFSSSDTSKDCRTNPVIHSNVTGNSLGMPEPMQRRMQNIPFNSSVLRSNHQNASDQMRISYLRPDVVFPPFGAFTREPDRQNQSGLVLGSTATSAAQAVEGEVTYKSHMVHPAGQVYRANASSYAGTNEGQNLDSRVPQSASQGAATTVKGKLNRPYTTSGRESLKRRLYLPLPASPQGQRRKIMPQTLMYPYSPRLLQDVLGQTGKSMPTFTSCSKPSIVPTAAEKGLVANGSNKNPTSFSAAAWTIGAPSTRARTLMHPTASAEAFISPTPIPSASNASSQGIALTFPSATMSSPATFANISPIPVIASEGPTLLPPPNIRAPTALARTVTTPVSARRKTLLSHRSSALTPPCANSLRKSLPLAALAKASPTLRAPQYPYSMPHIKWQGFDTPQLSGVKCLLCKRDLSYTPEGSVSIPSIPPAVAILSCGHTFHDHCLLLITPADQLKDPPCIPCAIDEK